MNTQERVEFHTALLELYLRCWLDAEERDARRMRQDEAAYCALEHLGKLRRYSDTPWEVPQRVMEHAPLLVKDAIAYISRTNLAHQAKVILEQDDEELDDDLSDVESIENILLLRNGLDVVLDVVKGLASTAWLDQGTIGAWAAAKWKADEIDSVLLSHPAFVSVARIAMVELKDTFKEPIQPKRQWWFADDTEFERRVAEESRTRFEDLLWLAGEMYGGAVTAVQERTIAFPVRWRTEEAEEAGLLAAAAGRSEALQASYYLELRADDGSWRGIVDLPQESSRDENLVLYLPVRDGMLTAFSRQYTICDGQMTFNLHDLYTLWKASGYAFDAEVPVVLTSEGRASHGTLSLKKAAE